jgi:hypothetical protein
MNWYYFSRSEGILTLVPRKEMKKRPNDAQKGDEYTPWYKKYEHHDDYHVHVKGINEHDAERRAKARIKK